MSYSRWSNSRWYTFYTSFGGDTKKSQAFEVMIDFARSRIFTYDELNRDIDGCLTDIKNLCANPVGYKSPREILTEDFKSRETTIFDRITYVDEMSEPDPATEEELQELRVYMENFIADVEWDYSMLGKIIEFLIAETRIKKFGWWLKNKFQPKRKKYAGSSSREV